MLLAGDRIAVDVPHLRGASARDPGAAGRTHVIEKTERFLSVAALEHSAADPFRELQLLHAVHVLQKDGKSVGRREHVVGRGQSVHVHLTVEGGGGVGHRGLHPVQETVEKLTGHLVGAEAFLVQIVVDLFGIGGLEIVVLRVPERLFHLQRAGDVADDVAIAEIGSVDVVESAVVGMKRDAVEIVDVIGIRLVQLPAPADNVHAEVTGHAVAENDRIGLLLFDRLVGVPAEVDEPFRVSLRRMDQKTGFVAHFPDPDIVLPGLQHKVQIAVVNALDRDHQNTIPIVLRDLVVFRKIGRETVTSFFENVLNVRLRVEAADQAEDRFNPIFFHHPDCAVQRLFAEFSLFRFGCAPVAPYPSDRLSAETHVAERFLKSARK